jgi:hypothetical protein
VGKDSSSNSQAQSQQSQYSVNKYYLGRTLPAFVVITHKEEYLTDTIGIKLLKEQGILKKDGIGDDIDMDAGDASKYGKDAVNGIVRYIIDDKKYPNAYYHIVKTMKYIGLADKHSH